MSDAPRVPCSLTVPHEPHFYLSALGVDPTRQGTGIGTALLLWAANAWLLGREPFRREFPEVLANTVAAFALNDYEWMICLEAPELIDLVDMMRHLRYSDARLHVRDELPFHTGRRLDSLDDVAALLA